MGVRTREVSCVSTAGTHWTWNEGSSLSCVLGLVDVVRGRFASCVLLDMQEEHQKRARSLSFAWQKKGDN